MGVVRGGIMRGIKGRLEEELWKELKEDLGI